MSLWVTHPQDRLPPFLLFPFSSSSQLGALVKLFFPPTTVELSIPVSHCPEIAFLDKLGLPMFLSSSIRHPPFSDKTRTLIVFYHVPASLWGYFSVLGSPWIGSSFQGFHLALVFFSFTDLFLDFLWSQFAHHFFPTRLCHCPSARVFWLSFPFCLFLGWD